MKAGPAAAAVACPQGRSKGPVLGLLKDPLQDLLKDPLQARPSSAR